MRPSYYLKECTNIPQLHTIFCFRFTSWFSPLWFSTMLLLIYCSTHPCFPLILQDGSSQWKLLWGGVGWSLEDGSRFSHLTRVFWLSQTFAQLRDTRAASSPCRPAARRPARRQAASKRRSWSRRLALSGPQQTTDESKKSCWSPRPSPCLPEQA